VAKPIGGMPKLLLYEDFKREKYYNMPCKPKWNKYKSDYEKKWSVRIFTNYKIVDNENSLKTNRLMIGKFLIFNDRKSQSVLVCQGDYLSLSGEEQDKKNELEDGSLEKWVYSVKDDAWSQIIYKKNVWVYSVKDDAWSKKIDGEVHAIYKREGTSEEICVKEPLLHKKMTSDVYASDTIEKVEPLLHEKMTTDVDASDTIEKVETLLHEKYKNRTYRVFNSADGSIKCHIYVNDQFLASMTLDEFERDFKMLQAEYKEDKIYHKFKTESKCLNYNCDNYGCMQACIDNFEVCEICKVERW